MACGGMGKWKPDRGARCFLTMLSWLKGRQTTRRPCPIHRNPGRRLRLLPAGLPCKIVTEKRCMPCLPLVPCFNNHSALNRRLRFFFPERPCLKKSETYCLCNLRRNRQGSDRRSRVLPPQVPEGAGEGCRPSVPPPRTFRKPRDPCAPCVPTILEPRCGVLKTLRESPPGRRPTRKTKAAAIQSRTASSPARTTEGKAPRIYLVRSPFRTTGARSEARFGRRLREGTSL